MPWMGFLRLFFGVVTLMILDLEFGYASGNTTGTGNADEENGPVFVREPPSKMDFSNSTGAEIPCQARGTPQAEIIWLRADGTAIGDVPGLRQVLASGALVFPPFRAEDYRQEVHAQTYVCLARNSVGTIHSRDVQVRAVVSQQYATSVMDDFVISGNNQITKCNIPAIVSGSVFVTSWFIDETPIERSDNFGMAYFFGTNQNIFFRNYGIKACARFLYRQISDKNYAAKVFEEDVIFKNNAIFKCLFTPAFIIDFLEVESWYQDDVPIKRTVNGDYVITQYYEVDVIKQHAIIQNHAIFTCSLSPPFVMDLVKVESWLLDDIKISRSDKYAVYQTYATKVYDEDIIKHNAAVFKCISPSYVGDFVQVESWFHGETPIRKQDNYVVTQFYDVDVNKQQVISNNAAIFKCQSPSFVVDFVGVEKWFQGDVPIPRNENYVVTQSYEIDIVRQQVISRNSAIFKCLSPSFVIDFIEIEKWFQGDVPISRNDQHYVVNQDYIIEAQNDHVYSMNYGILRCFIPFGTDYFTITSWMDSNGEIYSAESPKWVIPQHLLVQVHDKQVIRGNHIIFTCSVSFSTEYLYVTEWRTSSGDVFTPDNSKTYVIPQHVLVEVHNKQVIRGNNIIFTCSLSFSTEYMTVTEWRTSTGEVYTLANSQQYVVSQNYDTAAENEYVISYNSAVMKCKMGSYIAEFLEIVSWHDNDGNVYSKDRSKTNDGKFVVLPSGELHIKDVRPEDGLKEYRCQTKHRLTGETRLSATAGKLVVTELSQRSLLSTFEQKKLKKL